MNCPVICQSVQSQMADFSAGQLSPIEANLFDQHCAQCARCRCEWETFQSTMLLLSGLCQPLPCEESSEEMWEVCASDWMMRVEMRRSKMPLWGALRGWAMQQPRWGWVAISGAVTVFIGVWLLSPSNAPSEAVNFAAVTSEIPADGGPLRVFNPSQTAAMQSGISIFPSHTNNTRRVEFSVPSAMASSAVDYHASMSFDPFVDHVGSGLISSSAQPLANQSVTVNQVPAPPKPVIDAPLIEQPVAAKPTLAVPLSAATSVAVAPPALETPVLDTPVSAPLSEPR